MTLPEETTTVKNEVQEALESVTSAVRNVLPSIRKFKHVSDDE